ncbi:unnamed protein product, partial [Allacma fusca]
MRSSSMWLVLKTQSRNSIKGSTSNRHPSLPTVNCELTTVYFGGMENGHHLVSKLSLIP